jgi:hypothetical protein
MPALIILVALVVLAIVFLAIVGAALHLLFSPWLLVAVVAVLAWIKFRPRRSHL